MQRKALALLLFSGAALAQTPKDASINPVEPPPVTITTPKGAAMTFDGQGRFSQIVSPSGRVIQFVYDGAAQQPLGVSIDGGALQAITRSGAGIQVVEGFDPSPIAWEDGPMWIMDLVDSITNRHFDWIITPVWEPIYEPVSAWEPTPPAETRRIIDWFQRPACSNTCSEIYNWSMVGCGAVYFIDAPAGFLCTVMQTGIMSYCNWRAPC